MECKKTVARFMTKRLGDVQAVFRLHDIPADLAGYIENGMGLTGAACSLFAPDDTLAYASPAFARLWDVQPGSRTFADMMRHCHAARRGPIIETDDIEGWLQRAGSKRRSKPERCFEIDMHDGRWFWVREATFDGGWLFLTACDITELKDNERILRKAHDMAVYWAETDALTRLHNRHYAMTKLDEAVRAAQATGEALSVALLDIDHFKAINDGHGHDVGDLVLQHFARTAQTRVRSSDVLARVGGEEFLLIMPGAMACDTFQIMERLRDHVASAWPVGADVLRYTFSCGVVQLRSEEAPHELYRRADQALYRAKRDGRNRVEAEVNPLDLGASG
jgi:diguanylate cyclase (GGDEF)-like protein